MFCPNCGSQMPDGSRFCAQCGKAVATVHQPTAPQPVASQPVAPVAPVKPVKKKRKLPVAIIAVVLVVALVVGICFLAFGKKTEYLLVESATVTGGNENVWRYEYDEMGILLSHERSLNGMDTEYTYHYDDDGRIESVEYETDGMTMELEYHYNDDGVLEEISGGYEGTEIVAECNDDGLVETVETYSQGELISQRTYTYHDNGVLATVEKKTYQGGEVFGTITSTYSETGKELTVEYEPSEGTSTYQEFCYDDEDRMVGWTYIQIYEGMTATIELAWEINKDGMIANPTMVMETEEDGETQSATITGKVEYDDESCSITMDEFDSDDMDEDELGFEDAVIEIEYGDHGLMTEMVVEVSGEEFMSYTWEYEEVEVPRDYQKVITADPIWGMFA